MSLQEILDSQELDDAGTLVNIASAAGVSTESAKAILAALSELPMVQALRICTNARTMHRLGGE